MGQFLILPLIDGLLPPIPANSMLLEILAGPSPGVPHHHPETVLDPTFLVLQTNS